ncbi:DUF2075 domain-containing protein [Methanogenium sp. S4BF]|uniref:DUF2075 domain-containing protein n=1 Tax=Methanogenium sp. S4BF TaxID=1789226 RepID=UPI0024180D82|nr:DUF2075 domain-containing protein [Methanogenium sp. S4BF]WFN33462.1 DUF2075 domain-containing protein [Methanogenium sp. S4BF]
MTLPCGYRSELSEFLEVSYSDWLGQLQNHHIQCMHEPASRSQITAWKNSFKVLQRELPKLIEAHPDACQWSILFEYELPREGGRRPDVVILGQGTIYVIEFKDFRVMHQAHVDQVDAYARDLQHYHALSHDYQVIPLLLLTKSASRFEKSEKVRIISPDTLVKAIIAQNISTDTSWIDPVAWLNADYSPLPSLISAARIIFNNEPLPHIRRALSAGIPQTIEALNGVAQKAKEKNERHLAFVTGVPGAGKTLVGIQFVYENVLVESVISKNAVFLSGNGPLVQVLKHALKTSVFVQDVHRFLKQYGGTKTKIPHEHIWIYDEAQRAWDAKQVEEKRGHSTSEPEDFLTIGERMDSWVLMIALIGEGQEIHLGEESGLPQWNEAIAEMEGSWTVHCPTKIASVFPDATAIQTNEALDLTITLRSHLAEDVSEWIQNVLDGDFVQARELADRMYEQGFDMYITTQLSLATEYVKDRYMGQSEKRYGLLASSKAKNLPDYGIHNEFNYTRTMKVGPWYNDPQDSPQSCCALHDVATEFSCQGLELDFPIVCWGSDFCWDEDQSQWKSPKVTRMNKARDPHRLRMNSYRVLLSRGRDGFIIFVPPEQRMASTYRALKAAGVREIRNEYADAVGVAVLSE